jgi:hypothetical protein
MVHDSVRNLKFDRRLLRWRGWISQQELERELEKLPDAASRAETVTEPRPSEEEQDRGPAEP